MQYVPGAAVRLHFLSVLEVVEGRVAPDVAVLGSIL
jgi:hypothetical protein